MARNNLKQQLAQNVARRQSRLQDTEPALPPPTLDPAAREVPLAQVRANPLNPRQIDLSDPEQTAALEVLVLSLQTHGILQPPIVRELPAGGYEIIAGDRRFLAAQKAGLQTIPVRVRQAEDAVLRQINMVENLVRAELSPADMGRGFAELKRALQLDHERQRNQDREQNQLSDATEPTPDSEQEQTSGRANATPGSHSLTWQDVASITGLTTRSMQRYIAVANLIEELDEADLPTTEKAKVRNLTEKQLRPALSLEAGPQRTEFIRQIARENLSSRQSEHLAKTLRAASLPKSKSSPSNSKTKAASKTHSSTEPDASTKPDAQPSTTIEQGLPETISEIERTLLSALGQLEQVIETLTATTCNSSQYERNVQPHLNALHQALGSLENLNPDKKVAS